MPRVKKLILVTATHHPLHNLWVKLLDRLASDHGVEKEIRIEDYVLLVEHGATDEYGMAWLPQLLAEMDDGSIKLVLAKFPLNDALQPDFDKAVEIASKRLEELAGGT